MPPLLLFALLLHCWRGLLWLLLLLDFTLL
jgi:hypothetical protein